MTLKEAIESGKPFRRQSWAIDHYGGDGWLQYEWEYRGGKEKVEIPYRLRHDKDSYQYEFDKEEILATDWILKYDCEECKDTGKVGKMENAGTRSATYSYHPCPKCSTPKTKEELTIDTDKAWEYAEKYMAVHAVDSNKLLEIAAKKVDSWREKKEQKYKTVEIP